MFVFRTQADSDKRSNTCPSEAAGGWTQRSDRKCLPVECQMVGSVVMKPPVLSWSLCLHTEQLGFPCSPVLLQFSRFVPAYDPVIVRLVRGGVSRLRCRTGTTETWSVSMTGSSCPRYRRPVADASLSPQNTGLKEHP